MMCYFRTIFLSGLILSAGCDRDKTVGPTSAKGQIVAARTGEALPFSKAVLVRKAVQGWGTLFSRDIQIDSMTTDVNGNFEFHFTAEEDNEYKVFGMARHYSDGGHRQLSVGSTNDNLKVYLDPHKLPDFTTEGKNTFGFLLNGKVWLPRYDKRPEYELKGNVEDTWSRVYATQDNWELGIVERIQFVIYHPTGPLDTGKYLLKAQIMSKESYAEFSIGSQCGYKPTDANPGILYIKKIDRVNRIISGTFEMEFISTGGCDPIQITEGRFDIKY